MFKPEFTTEEVNALIQLMDMATKANGLAVAEASLTLIKKIKDSEVKSATTEATAE